MSNTPPSVILASQSVYRRELLERVVPSFAAQPAAIDETPQPGESPAKLASRLAKSKCLTVAKQHSAALVIGSDQVAALGNEPLGKPGTPENAVAQLTACSGSAVVFYTSVYVNCTASGFKAEHTDVTTVRFRDITRSEIDAYLALDEPWDCAGSFKSEAHGALLFTAIETSDPTALIGLPLIWLGNCLRAAGLDPLAAR